MSETPADVAAVRQRLDEIRSHKRGRIRWSISKHTAELALDALLEEPPRNRPRAKSRRRKRHKRLL